MAVRAVAPLLTLATIALLETALRAGGILIPNPAPILLVALAYGAFVSGLRAGLAGAALALVYLAFFYSGPSGPWLGRFTAENAARMAVVCVVAPAIVLLIGILKRRLARAAAAAATMQAREELRNAEEARTSLAAFVVSSPDAVLGFTPEGIITFWNPAAERIFGFTAAQALGRPAAILAPPERLAEQAERFERVRRGEPVPTYETVRRTADGGAVEVSISLTPILHPQSRVLTGVGAIVRDITERRRAEAALRESEELNRRILQSSADCIKVVDLEGRLLSLNEPGITRLEIDDINAVLGDSWFDFWPEPGRSACREAAAEAIAGNTGRFVGFCPTFKGAPRWWDVHINPLVGPSGKPERLVAVSRDVTEHRQAEEALRLAEERHRLALEGAELGTFFWEMPTRKIHWNPRFKELFFLPPDAEITYELLLSLLHPDDREPTRLAMENSQANRALYDVEYRALAPAGSGRQRWIHAIGRGYYDEGTGELAHFDGVAFDITARKQAIQAAVESAERVRTILESITSAFFSLDREWRFTYVNEAAERLLSRPRQELLGRSVWEEFPKAVGTTFDHEYRRAAESGVPADFEEFFPPLNTWFEVHAYPSAEGLSVYFHDITVRRQTAAERDRLLDLEREARASAESANRLKDEFLATLSHELRTPLNAILGWTHLMQADPEDAETRASALEIIERNTRAQVQLIEDLLDVSRIITGKMRLEVRPVDLAAVVGAALDSARPTAEARGVRLQSLLDPFAGPVSGDPDRLQQIVWNLLSNALKFTPKGGRVQVRLERRASFVHILVSDTGQGISPEFLPHVFDRFRQADSSSTRAYTGLGLGLALVRHLVELHGGTVEALSDGPGQGSTFTVRLPLAIMHAAARSGLAGGRRTGKRLPTKPGRLTNPTAPAPRRRSAASWKACASSRWMTTPTRGRCCAPC